MTEADLEACGIVPSVSMNAKVESWTADPAYDPNVPGSYTFTGTLAASDAFTNDQNLQVKATVTVREMPAATEKDHSVPFSQVEVTDEFWSNRQKQMVCEVIPTAMENISKTGGGLNNFKLASEYLATKEGEYTTENAPMHEGAKYVDSDVWKVIESMAYALQLDAKGDSEMLAGQAYIRQKLNEWIPWFVGSQEADGYLYTAFTLRSNNGDCPDSQMRFTGRSDDMQVHTDGSYYETVGTAAYDESVDYDDHELYCMGHFYEAAVAHYRATGDFRLLDVAVKNANLVARTFGYDDKTQVQAVPGHQEIELALIKLAEVCLEIGGEYAEKAARYVEVARFFMSFTQRESCGKCGPCRIGTKRMLEILEKIVDGRGEPEDLEKLEHLAHFVKDRSLCGLGKSAPLPVLSTIENFRDEYMEHIVEKKCAAHVCKAMRVYAIDPEKCKGCTKCARNCPAGAITGNRKEPHVIDASKCIKCGACMDNCAFGAVYVE